MTIRVDLSPETEARLIAEARAHGLPLEKVAERLDARLVAAMHVYGVKRILTFNHKDFARYTDSESVHPRTVSRR